MTRFHSINGHEIEAHYAGGQLLQDISDISDGITGGGPTDTAAWLQRTCPGTDGPATIESIHGRTLVWNQHVRGYSTGYWTKTTEAAISSDDTAQTLTLTSSSDSSSAKYARDPSVTLPAGHTYLIRANIDATHMTSNQPSLQIIQTGTGGTALLLARMDAGTSGVASAIGAIAQDGYPCVRFATSTPSGDYAVYSNMQIFDLTQMFGAGNEPSTVAEFEALYPEPYYPYDAGSLLSVQMDGVESAGHNLWGGIAMHDSVHAAIPSADDGTNEHGSYVLFGAPSASGKHFFDGPYKENTRYTLILRIGKNNTANGTNVRVWYTDGSYSNITRSSTANDGSPETRVWHSDPNKTIRMVGGVNSSGNTYLYYDQCGLFEGYLTEDDFEPYWKSERTIPAATYFPQGMRGAGSFYDELTNDAAVTRMGEVDLGTLEWSIQTYNEQKRFRATVSGGVIPGIPASATYYDYATTLPWPNVGGSTTYNGTDCIAVGGTTAFYVYLGIGTYQTVEELKAGISGKLLTYPLATPTMQTIEPPLNMSYRVENYGTERVMVPAGEQSAPPTLTVTYGSTADGIRDRALACIAPVEGSTASANYGVGSYLIHAGQLCRVTTAIAAGEAITIGTNVTATTVMAELLTLTQ